LADTASLLITLSTDILNNEAPGHTESWDLQMRSQDICALILSSCKINNKPNTLNISHFRLFLTPVNK